MGVENVELDLFLAVGVFAAFAVTSTPDAWHVVKRVVGDRIAEILQVDPNLVSASGQWVAEHDARLAIVADPFELGYRLFSKLLVHPVQADFPRSTVDGRFDFDPTTKKRNEP